LKVEKHAIQRVKKKKKNKQSPNFHLPFFKSLLIIASPFTFTSPTTTHREKKEPRRVKTEIRNYGGKLEFLGS
jgi:hypothetical protein